MRGGAIAAIVALLTVVSGSAAANEWGSEWGSPRLVANSAPTADNETHLAQNSDVFFTQDVRFAEVARLGGAVSGVVHAWNYPESLRIEAGASLFRIDLGAGQTVVFCGYDVFRTDDGHIGRVGRVCLADDNADARFDR